MPEATVKKVSGPLVIAVGLEGARMYELVHVGPNKLFGEIIEIRGKEYSIQVYENTDGVTPGDPVEPTGMPLSVELGPGLIRSIYDGVQRPLDKIRAMEGDFIVRGTQAPALDREKQWHFTPVAKAGDKLHAGDILGTVQETDVIEHRIMVPPNVAGTLKDIKELDGNVETTIAVLDSDGKKIELNMLQRWPVRQARPIGKRLRPDTPLVTGQRILDMLFPLAKGGTACVPGPFGSGKTVVQHQLARWADAEVIVYVGCGERGNEMTDVLIEFPELKDPKSGKALIERTVLVANTSNMPVAAREASVFTGITMAEYFRDMGYNVAMMADSTSRWAEAMREISGRLGEMPGEEGYPAYLTSRIAGFYERAGAANLLATDERKGSVTLIGSVSPPGGDLSEPVVQATLRVVRVFWGLDDRLASQRHFPAINWLTSYSLYQSIVDAFGNKEVRPEWQKNRTEAMALLQREAELEEIVRLVGMDALSPADRLTLQAAKMIREDFLHQNAFDDIDTFTSLEKQFMMLDAILEFHKQARTVIEAGVPFDKLLELDVLEEISRSKLLKEPEGKPPTEELDGLKKKVVEQVTALAGADGKAVAKDPAPDSEDKEDTKSK